MDFVVTEENKPVSFIECKKGRKGSNKALRYLKQRFPGTSATSIFLEEGSAFEDKDGIIHQPATEFLASLV